MSNGAEKKKNSLNLRPEIDSASLRCPMIPNFKLSWNRTGPPGYIGWRNSFLGIDSWAPYTFKNTSSLANPRIVS